MPSSTGESSVQASGGQTHQIRSSDEDLLSAVSIFDSRDTRCAEACLNRFEAVLKDESFTECHWSAAISLGHFPFLSCIA